MLVELGDGEIVISTVVTDGWGVAEYSSPGEGSAGALVLVFETASVCTMFDRTCGVLVTIYGKIPGEICWT